jgi:hypothetical protein
MVANGGDDSHAFDSSCAAFSFLSFSLFPSCKQSFHETGIIYPNNSLFYPQFSFSV